MLSRYILCLALLPLSFQAAAEAPKKCQNTQDFVPWLTAFKQDASAQGVSAATIKQALSGLSPDPQVIKMDRRQNVFAQDFLTFSDRMVNNYRLTHGKKNIQKYADTFARIEQDYGVPAPVIAAFWGLETDYGVVTGDMPTIRSLVTLAWDCRRPELFREQLIATLKIIDRGDLVPSEMRGAWAGELGQTQFLPSEYLEKGVDYDGDGKVNLIKSKQDVLASTAHVIQLLGWQSGQPWLEEVRVPDSMPWEQASTTIEHPISQWDAWGVTKADGSPLTGNLQASLLLLMGRNGPAFLAYPNFKNVYLEWNNSIVYSATAAYFATRLGGAAKVNRGKTTVTPLSLAETKRLQSHFEDLGYDVGGVDGIIGSKTRAAVQLAQLELGLPADGYPDDKLLSKISQLKPLPLN